MWDMDPATATGSAAGGPVARFERNLDRARRLMASNSPPSPAGSSMIRFDA